MCKKLNVKPEDKPELGEICKGFVEAIRLERNKTTSKVNRAATDIEESMLNKELNFHAVNASIQPPTNFSPIPVLTTPKKMQEALKTFPCWSKQKFTGEADSVNIIEFLQAMNTAQQIMHLSEPEFLLILQKCVSGKVYTLVSECVSYGNNVNDVFHSLLTLYDNRVSSGTARRLLMSYRAPRTQTLMKVQSQIMEYASRIASDLPQGESRTQMFNIESNNALIRALPHHSANVVTNTINNLAARLQRNPSYVEVIKALHKYAESINGDIARNGVVHNRNHSEASRANFKVYGINQNHSNRDSNRKYQNRSTSSERNKKFNARGSQSTQGNKRFNVHAINMGGKRFESNMNQNRDKSSETSD